MKQLVSVVVAVYNGEKTLGKTLNSILNQTHADLEILVVDDGSTDNSVGVVESYKDTRIHLLSRENSGSPVAPRNLGIYTARGEFIAFCDQDDIWYPEKLETQLTSYDISKQKNEIGIIFCSVDLIDEVGNIIGRNMTDFVGYLSAPKGHLKMLNGNFITACSAMFLKSVIDEVGLLDESLVGVDDYDLWLRITEKYGVIFVQETLCAWRVDAKSLSADKAKQYIETEKIFSKLEDANQEIKFGHGKNLARILLATLLTKDFVTAKHYLQIVNEYPLSKKTSLIVGVSNFSLSLGYIFVSLLNLMGKVSL